MALFNGIAIADPAKKNLNFTTNEGFRLSVEGLNSDDRSSTNRNLKSTVITGVTSATKIENHYDTALKDDQLPHTTDGDQEILVKTRRDYDSVKGYRLEETVTVPLTTAVHRDVDDDQYAEENAYNARVEEPLLEADKYLQETDINGGAYYDPQSIYPTPTFKRTDRIVFRTPRSPSSRLANPQEYADEKHFLYVDGYKSFQERFYDNNPWRDTDTGRVNLFEAPREPSRLA